MHASPKRESDTGITKRHSGPPRSGDASHELDDLRFRALLDPEDWSRLPPAVRARFGKRLSEGRTVTYSGTITVCRMSPLGAALAQLLRLVGAPLPLGRDVDVPATVAVTEDLQHRGQFWTRIYGRHRGFPQVVQSSKRFSGSTGLEEHVGHGIGMALTMSASDEGLDFLSHHYYFGIGRLRLRLPACLTPGELLVRHRDRGHRQFDFVLRLVHPWFGELMYQEARFHDPVEASGVRAAAAPPGGGVPPDAPRPAYSK